MTELVPVGPQLSFRWRTPSLEVHEDFRAAYRSVDAGILPVLARARSGGVLAAGQPYWWLHQTLVALVYVAWECVASGRLARLDAADGWSTRC